MSFTYGVSFVIRVCGKCDGGEKIGDMAGCIESRNPHYHTTNKSIYSADINTNMVYRDAENV